MAYNEALLSGRLTTSRGGIVQSNFLGSLRKRVEELLHCDEALKHDFHNYIRFGTWPSGEFGASKSSILLSWYLQWFGVPSSSVINEAVDKIKAKLKPSSSFVPFLRLLFPSTNISVVGEIDKFLSFDDRE